MQDLEALYASLTFKNNPNLRPAYSHIPYTNEQVLEIAKCARNPIYFIEKYIKITHVDRGTIPLKLFPYQKELIKKYHKNRKNLVLQPRQTGKTVISAAFMTWYAIFNSEKTVIILANKDLIAKEILGKIKQSFELLPKWLQPGVITWNKGRIEFDNKSRVVSAATSSSAVRGMSGSFIFVDEFAIIEANVAEEFLASVFPVISSGKDTKICIASTPMGYNHFYRFWRDAEQGLNGFVTHKVAWNEHPDRDDAWLKNEIQNIGELKAAQEIFCNFTGSSRQLLKASTLDSMSYDKPIKEYAEEYVGLRIYAAPAKGKTYTMTCDVSRGRHLDDSAFTVYDISTQPFTVAAVYNNNEVSPLMYANIIHKIGKNYNDAFVLVEINDAGSEVASALYYDFEYENMYWTKAGSQLGKKGADPYPGLRTTKKTKIIGCANAKDLIERQNLIINDEQTIQQFSTFVQNDTGTYAGEDNKDDLVMTHVLFGWLANQPWFKDLTDQDMRTHMYAESIKQIEDDLTPSIFFSNGIEDSPWYDKEAMEMLL